MKNERYKPFSNSRASLAPIEASDTISRITAQDLEISKTVVDNAMGIFYTGIYEWAKNPTKYTAVDIPTIGKLYLKMAALNRFIRKVLIPAAKESRSAQSIETLKMWWKVRQKQLLYHQYKLPLNINKEDALRRRQSLKLK